MTPACECHGELMYWQKDSRYRAGGFWGCAVKQRDRVADRYHRDFFHRVNKQLRHRRYQALRRRRERQRS